MSCRSMSPCLFLFFLWSCNAPSPEAPVNETATEAAGEAEAPVPSLSVEDDPFNTTATAAKIEELGLPTVPRVEELEDVARLAFEAGDCTAAVPALEEFSRQANWIANLIAAGLRPFYDASSSDVRNMPGSRLNALVPFETASNSYKTKRDRAMVMQAQCLRQLGQEERAVALLVNALDLLPLDEAEWWDRARTELYEMIQIVDSAGSLQSGS